MRKIFAAETRKSLLRLTDEVHKSRKPILIAKQRRAAILACEKYRREVNETLFLLSIPGMGESIIKGMKTPVGKCSSKKVFRRAKK